MAPTRSSRSRSAFDQFVQCGQQGVPVAQLAELRPGQLVGHPAHACARRPPATAARPPAASAPPGCDRECCRVALANRCAENSLGTSQGRSAGSTDSARATASIAQVSKYTVRRARSRSSTFIASGVAGRRSSAPSRPGRRSRWCRSSCCSAAGSWRPPARGSGPGRCAARRRPALSRQSLISFGFCQATASRNRGSSRRTFCIAADNRSLGRLVLGLIALPRRSPASAAAASSGSVSASTLSAGKPVLRSTTFPPAGPTVGQRNQVRLQLPVACLGTRLLAHRPLRRRPSGERVQGGMVEQRHDADLDPELGRGPRSSAPPR